MTAWHEQEDRVLKTVYPTDGRRVVQRVLLELGWRRTALAIKARAKRMGLTFVKWSGYEDWVIRQCYPQYGSEYCQKYMPKRSLIAIRNRANKLDVRTQRRGPVDNETMQGDHLKALEWVGVIYRD